MQIKGHKLFHDPLYITVFEDINNDVLTEQCYKIKELNGGRIKTNIGGYQSNDIYEDLVLEHELFEFQKLVDNIHTKLDHISANYNAVKKLRISNIWVNINSKNDFNNAHAHPHSWISGSYYVKVPANCQSGIVFYRERSVIDYNMHRWLGENNNNVFESTFTVYPEPGACVTFPSYLQHRVEPNKSDESRISIAYNTYPVDE